MAAIDSSDDFETDAKESGCVVHTFEKQKDALLFVNVLSFQEQVAAMEAIEKGEKACKSIQMVNKNPNSKTIMVINPNNHFQLKQRGSPIFNFLFGKILSLIEKSKVKTCLPTMKDYNSNKLKCVRIKSLEYNVENGAIEPHCDGRNGYIMIFSFGNIANFELQGSKMEKIKKFEFKNGDCLIFDASKNANIIHSISSIKKDSFDKLLANKFKRLIDTRICVMIEFQYS